MHFIIIVILVVAMHAVIAAEPFALKQNSTAQLFGPFELADDAPLGKTSLIVILNSNNTFNLVGFVRGVKQQYGPFFFTNGAPIAIVGEQFSLICGDSMHAANATLTENAEREIQRQRKLKNQTDEISASIKAVKDETLNEEETLRQLESAIKMNPEANNIEQARSFLQQRKSARQNAIEMEHQKREDEESTRLAEQHANEIPSIINGFLREQASGRSGSQYWDEPQHATLLYAPVSWEIVDSPRIFGLQANVVVRVESSTKGGFPIRKLWTIYMRYRMSGWRVTLIMD